MTPAQKIKHLVLLLLLEWDPNAFSDLITAENIDDLYDEQENLQDYISEVRSSGIETGLPCQSSRHYESDAVAAQLPDGSWVGWTYWYGGGKHGEPEAVDWIEHAYDIVCHEEEKVVTVRTFSTVE